MTPQQYLEQILAKYNLGEKEIENIQKQRKVIEDNIKGIYSSKINNFYYSGSYAKGTAISLKYDIDLCIYFKNDAFSTLKDMYDQVFGSLRHLNPRRQIVSIRITNGSENIDVVPARLISNDSTDANLFVTTNGGSIKTNIPKHKDYISQHKCRPIIKLMKVWKNLHSIHYKSFALEILTIRALDDFRSEDYGDQVLQVLKYIRDNVETVKLVDPANTNNIVSDLISYNDKINMKNNADASLRKQSWNEIIW